MLLLPTAVLKPTTATNLPTPLTIITIREIEIIKTEAVANTVKTVPTTVQAMIAVMNVLAPVLVLETRDLPVASTKTAVLMIVVATDLLPTAMMIVKEATPLLIHLLLFAVPTMFPSATLQPMSHLKMKDILTKEDVNDPNRMTSTNQMESTDYLPMPALLRS